MASLKLHAFGSNGSGQLGIGHREDVAVPQACQWRDNGNPVSQPETGVQSMAAGGNHTFLLFRNGALFASGDNAVSQCSDVSDFEETTVFRRITLMSEDAAINGILQVSATWTATTFVTEAGVFSRGYGPKGELGLGSEVASAHSARRIPSFPPEGTTVTDIKACMSHTIALLSNGEVYGWGNGRKGQLGVPSEIVWEPRKIDLTFHAAAIACGRDFSIFVGPSADGRLLVLGSDKHGVISAAPASIRGWNSVSASWCSIHVVVNNGTLISWGRHDRGQLLGSGMEGVELIGAGSEHVVARMCTGAVLTWGWGEHGNCGPDHSENVAHTVANVEGAPGFIGAGCATSFLSLASNG